MAKRITALLAVCALLCAALPAPGEAEDYSWLDDMTINQLKALDAEIHKRLPASDAQTGTADILSLLLGGGQPQAAKNVEAKELKINEKYVADTAEFTVLGTAIKGTRDNSPASWQTIEGSGAEGSFYLDADCGAFVMIYRVKNTGTTSEWYWPSNLAIHIQWGDYEFEKVDARPFGDLPVTQEKPYIAVVQIPNGILKKGCDDIVIEYGFKENFKTCSKIEDADYRFVMHISY